MRQFEIVSSLQQLFSKLHKKDNVLYEQTMKKIEEIINSGDIEHYKNLRYDMKDKKRVHIGHFVLIFQYIKDKDTILFLEFDHHDNVYRY